MYDIIIMRGSFNYKPLFPEDIVGSCLVSDDFNETSTTAQLLHPEGVFLFNTFKEPEEEVTYRHLTDIDNDNVFEIKVYDKSDKVIYHNLFTKEEIIRHRIYCMSRKEIFRQYHGGVKTTISRMENDTSVYYKINFKRN